MNRIDKSVTEWLLMHEFLEKYPYYFKEAIKDHADTCHLTGKEIKKGDRILFIMIAAASETEVREVELMDDGPKVEVPEIETWVKQVNVTKFAERDTSQYYFAKNNSKAIAFMALAENL